MFNAIIKAKIILNLEDKDLEGFKSIYSEVMSESTESEAINENVENTIRNYIISAKDDIEAKMLFADKCIDETSMLAANKEYTKLYYRYYNELPKTKEERLEIITRMREIFPESREVLMLDLAYSTETLNIPNIRTLLSKLEV